MTRSFLVTLALGLLGQAAAFAQDAPATPPAAPVAPTTWQYPLDAAVSADGTYFIADRKLPGIWKLKDGQNTILYQGKKQFRTPLNAVRCVHVAADGTLYAGDSATREVYSVSPTGEIKALTHGSIGIPTAIAVVEGTVYVTDLELQRIWKFPTAGLPATEQPTEFAVIGGCRGFFADDKGFLWVLSSLKPQLQKFTAEGKPEIVVDDLVFEFPHQVCVTTDGTAYVTDGYAKAIWKIAPGGKPEKWVSGVPFQNPIGIRQQGADFIVCDSRANALFKVTADGKVETIFSGPPNPLPVVPAAATPAASPGPKESQPAATAPK